MGFVPSFRPFERTQMQLTPRHARNTLKLGPADGQHKLETGVGGGGGGS